MKITAMYLEEAGKIVPRKIDMPRIDKDEVLVRIKAVGICGSDVHYYTSDNMFEGQCVCLKLIRGASVHHYLYLFFRYHFLGSHYLSLISPISLKGPFLLSP